jgi:sec-independent protein translocase protein TatA
MFTIHAALSTGAGVCRAVPDLIPFDGLMRLAALLNLGGGEVILILALILILVGAKRLPEIGQGFWQGIKEFRKATREVREEMTGQKADDTGPSHPVLMAVTLVLGAACVILVVYECSK